MSCKLAVFLADEKNTSMQLPSLVSLSLLTPFPLWLTIFTQRTYTRSIGTFSTPIKQPSPLQVKAICPTFILFFVCGKAVFYVASSDLLVRRLFYNLV
jgi:hypothetical protein